MQAISQTLSMLLIIAIIIVAILITYQALLFKAYHSKANVIYGSAKAFKLGSNYRVIITIGSLENLDSVYLEIRCEGGSLGWSGMRPIAVNPRETAKIALDVSCEPAKVLVIGYYGGEEVGVGVIDVEVES